MRTSLPTEREVLLAIYEMYEDSYPGEKPGENDPLIEIDFHKVAEKLGCKPHLLFGYLYYYLEHKYRYQTAPNTFVHLFVVQAGQLRHAVNYPYLAGILAAANQEHSKFWWGIGISIAAFVISVVALVVGK